MSEDRHSLLDSARTLLGTCIGILETRLELVATEIQEEKSRLLGIVTLGAIAFVLLSLGLVFLSITITVLLWDEHRLLALGIFSAIFLLGGGAAFFVVLRNATSHHRLFAASLAELKNDRAALHGEPRD